MKIEKNDLGKAQFELVVEMSYDELKPYYDQGAKKVSQEVKIDGFRSGNVPIEVLRQKIGDMTILEEAANIAIHKSIDNIFKDNIEREIVGQPKVEITKLAPENPLEFKIVVAVLPEIKLGEYRDLKIKKKKVEIADAEIEKILNDLREMRVKEILSDGEIKDGGKVLIDIAMFLDKVPVEGGQGKDAAIIIGKDYIVPGFDKKIIGAKKGDVREFELPYPEDFHMKNLAGKMVDFRVTVKEVYTRELPALDDDFAAAFGLKKFADFKDNVKKSVESQKEKEADQILEKEIIEKILEKTRVNDIPELLIEHESHNMVHELEHTIEEQGGKFEDYLASIKKTHDQMILELLPEAVKRVKASLLIREIATKENIKVSDEEVEKHLEEMKKHYHDNQEILAKLRSPEYFNYVYNVFASKKVVDKLIEWNVEK